jgi:hypothetical protein
MIVDINTNFSKWTSTLAMQSNGPLPQVHAVHAMYAVLIIAVDVSVSV